MTLTCVAVVCCDRPAIDALDHVVQTLNDLLDHSGRWSIPTAAGAGHLHLLQRLTASAFSPDSMPSVSKKLLRSAMQRAAENGHVHILDWLKVSTSPELAVAIARGILRKAVAGGHVEAARWIDAKYPEESCEAMAIISAARGGHLAVIQWIVRRRRLEWIVAVAFFDPLMEAATCGQLGVVQWICRWTRTPRDLRRLAVLAKYHGHAEVAAWLTDFEAQQSGFSSRSKVRQYFPVLGGKQ